ncbi:MAG: rhodanese-like domain-containing protein [Gilvibacter sp.]
MIWKINSVLLILIVLGCGDTTKKSSPIAEQNNLSSPSYLIEIEDLAKIENSTSLKIIDFRKPALYAKEHIKGAVNIWRSHIEDSSYAYGGMMASKQQLEALFSGLGISDKHTLIIYDDNGLCDAARLWWILQNYDITKVKMLHGGLEGWKKAGGMVTSDLPESIKTEYTLPDNPSMRYLASKEEVLHKVRNDEDVLLLDTRTQNEFSGKRLKNGAAKAGRITNSNLLDWSRSVNYSGDKKFKSAKDLEAIYGGLDKNHEIIVYCHSGVRSAHTTFVLTQLLGFKNVKNYDGSWTEWSHFDELPFVRDSITSLKN